MNSKNETACELINTLIIIIIFTSFAASDIWIDSLFKTSSLIYQIDCLLDKLGTLDATTHSVRDNVVDLTRLQR